MKKYYDPKNPKPRRRRTGGRYRVVRNPSGMDRERDEPVMKEAGVGIVDWRLGLAICPGPHKYGLARVRYHSFAFTIWCPRLECRVALRHANANLAAAFAKKCAAQQLKLAEARAWIARARNRHAEGGGGAVRTGQEGGAQ
jgi:hypothetical protein